MPLSPPPKQFKTLQQLVSTYNEIPEEDGLQRLFYLQKINYILNKTAFDEPLLSWIHNSKEGSWQKHLVFYSINPYASFFLKGIQFAKAVVRQMTIENGGEAKLQVPLNEAVNEFILMQERDALLKSDSSFPESRELYETLCCQLNALASKDGRVSKLVERQTQILEKVQDKIESIVRPDSKTGKRNAYKTEQLGQKVNNYNFKLIIAKNNENPLVFRVEDRSDLGREQELHTYPVAHHFIEDYAMFPMVFKNASGGLEYRPVVLSQFAKQGDLRSVAKKIKQDQENIQTISSKAEFYFSQLTYFCARLIEAKTYHPDIKLSNFLVDGNRILISDRKTLLDEENPLASKVRSSPTYAPPEFIACLNPSCSGYNHKAFRLHMNMPQFMAYQLGMALKEFLLLTQMDEIPDEFDDADRSTASYFQSPSRQIINFSLLIQELTRSDPTKRLKIDQLHRLWSFRSQPPEEFYKLVEAQLPSSELGIEEEMKAITDVLEGGFSGEELLQKANPIFNQISEREPKESRLTLMTEKLAVKCFREYSYSYFSQCSKSLETVLLKQDWGQAPWYRKALHWLSFGYFRVERVAEVNYSSIRIQQDLKGDEFWSHFQQLNFIHFSELKRLGEVEGENLKEFILANVERILEHNGSPSPNSSAGINEKLSSSERSSVDFGSGNSCNTMIINKVPSEEDTSMETMVINKVPGEEDTSMETMVINKVPSEEDKPIETMVTKDESLEEEKPLTTMIIKNESTKDAKPLGTMGTLDEKSPSSSVRSHQHVFFPPDSGTTVKTPPVSRNVSQRERRIESVRSTLFRGDGSHRTNDKPQRLPLSAVNWSELS